MLILALDTSCRSAAVALLKDDTIIYDIVVNTGVHHSEILLPTINDACRHTGIKIDNVDLFVCTLGPGSFTGLRIGASTLKGFLLATGKPATGVSSLSALALNACESGPMICPVIDAGRGQVYFACYEYAFNGSLKQIRQEMVGKPEEVVKYLNRDSVLVGDGALKYKDVFEEGQKNVKLSFSWQQYIRGSAVAVLGREKYTRNELLEHETFIPLYLRSADALPARGLFKNQ